MKKLIISALASIFSVGAYAAFPLSTNDAINVPLYGGQSNVWAVSKQGNARVGGTLTVDGTATLSGAVTVSNSTVSGLSIKTSGDLSITNAQAITIPNRTVVRVASPGAFTTSTNTIAAPSTAQVGALVFLVNTGTNDILILESGVLSSAGNLTLGPKDGVWFYINATNDVIQNTGVINN